MSRQYYGIENLNMTNAQRDTLVDALKQIGDNQNPNPSRRNHRRIRLDGQAVIFEALWDDSDWTIDALKNRLGNVFGVDPATIDSSVNQTAYGPVVTLSRNAIDYIRLIAFGGLLATYPDSHALVLEYLFNNLAEWEPEDI